MTTYPTESVGDHPDPLVPGNVSRSRLIDAAGLAAAGVVFGAFVVVASLSSERGLAWRTFLSMAVLTLCFSGGAALSWLDSRRGVPASRTTGLLGSLAIGSLGLLIVASWDGDGWVYLSALAMLGAGAAAFWFLRENLFSIPAVVGAVVLVGQGFSDIVSDDEAGTGTLLAFGICLSVLGAAIVGAGWPFACRHLTGALGSIVAVGGMVFVLTAIGIASIFARAFAGPGGLDADPTYAHADRDLWLAMFIGIAVSLGVAGLGAVSGLDRYLVIAFAGAGLCTVIGIVTATREHPLRTALAFAFVAGLVVIAAVAGDRLWHRPNGAVAAPQGTPSASPPDSTLTLPPSPPAPTTMPPPPPPTTMPPPPPPSSLPPPPPGSVVPPGA